MKNSKVGYVLAILLFLGMGTAIYAQQLDEGLLVKLPNDVTVNDKKLPAGEYEIRKDSNVNPVFRFFNRGEMKYETVAMPILTNSNSVVEDSKVVMERIGSDYYLTKIWLAGTTSGYEIPLPRRARALQRELERSVPVEPLRPVALIEQQSSSRLSR